MHFSERGRSTQARLQQTTNGTGGKEVENNIRKKERDWFKNSTYEHESVHVLNIKITLSNQRKISEKASHKIISLKGNSDLEEKCLA